MDGGRVLRAALAARLSWSRATQIAAFIGQGLAFVFGFLGLFYNPLLIFIAIFVYLAASAEAQNAQIREVSGSVLVSDVMITEFATLDRMGGWPLFGAPQPYRDLFKPMAEKIAKNEFVIGAADTIGEEVAIAKEGLVTALVGQRPFEMGYKAPSVMMDLIAGKPVEDPVFTGLDECTKDTADTCIQK